MKAKQNPTNADRKLAALKIRQIRFELREAWQNGHYVGMFEDMVEECSKLFRIAETADYFTLVRVANAYNCMD